MISHITKIPVQVSITSKTLKVSISVTGIQNAHGLIVVTGTGGNKRLACIVLLGYEARLIEWANANMYTNSSCEVSGNADNGITITVKADQITQGDQMAVEATLYR